MKTILLTGASGFVGRNIILALSKLNVKVILIVRKGKKDKIIKTPNIVKIIKTEDIFKESIGWWKRHCKGIDIIIHAAWHVDSSKNLQSVKNIDCLIGSINMLSGAIKAGISRFVGIGTCIEYDLSKKFLSIDTPLNPKTLYSSSKVAFYYTLANTLPQKKIEFAWCRLFDLYGEGEDKRRLVSYIENQISKGKIAKLTSGNQIRDYLNVKKASKIITKIALSKQQGPINVCSGKPITIRKLATKIAAKYGRVDLLKFGLRKKNKMDATRIVGIPNYSK